jgi:hypothetical protein
MMITDLVQDAMDIIEVPTSLPTTFVTGDLFSSTAPGESQPFDGGQ